MVFCCCDPHQNEDHPYHHHHRHSRRTYCRGYYNAPRQKLTVLFLILITFFFPVGGRFGVQPPSMEINELERDSSDSSFVLLNYSGPQPSDKFISCHFNPGCFCKYDQKTEIYESLQRLWQLSGFNESSYARAVLVLQKEIRSDPTTTYFFPESDFTKLAQSAINSTTFSSPLQYQYSYSAYSSSNRQGQYGGRGEEPGPIFEFVCLTVPMAAVPTGKF